MQRQNAVEIADIQLDNRLRSKPQRGQRQTSSLRPTCATMLTWNKILKSGRSSQRSAGVGHFSEKPLLGERQKLNASIVTSTTCPRRFIISIWPACPSQPKVHRP